MPLRFIQEGRSLFFFEPLQHFDFPVGLRQRLTAELKLLSDQFPFFVDPANVSQQLQAVVAPRGSTVHGDTSTPAEPADLLELAISIGEQSFAL